ncbi:DUF2357 domain-containing protein [Paenibacillus rhizolycopersici]|uniref:DUF2357 domain-containing protein n=1 Tax=Paenibacillus rhizolycopersici TaxID=2780073 RepID=UPI003D2B5E1C
MFRAHAIYDRGAPVNGDLREWTDYVLEFETPLTESDKLQLLNDYRKVLKPLRGNLFLLNFRNFVGHTIFCGQSYTVSSDKMSKEDIHDMNRFISSRIALLPYYDHNPVKSYWTEKADEDAYRLHQWHLLREALFGEWEGASLQDWWRLIDRDPHNRINNEVVTSPIWSARTVRPDTLETIAQHPEIWVPIPKSSKLSLTAIAGRLTMQGQAYFPATALERINRLTFDTAENRMMKLIMSQFVELTEWMADRFSRDKDSIHGKSEILDENKKMQDELMELQMSDWVQETAELHSIPRASTVLQRKAGYRQWYSFYQHWLLGGKFPMPDEWIRTLVDMRDIAKIYEYWCFFMVANEIERKLGAPPTAVKRIEGWDEFGQLTQGLRLDFASLNRKISVYYNKCFGGGQQSYSQNYSPDISLESDGRWHHFDAKFKFEQSPSGVKAAKKEDIDKMHAYRDAIRNTETVWVLYPDSAPMPPRFHSINGSHSYDSGVGSIALSPNNGEGLTRVIEELLRI